LWTAIFASNRTNLVRGLRAVEIQLAGLRQDIQKNRPKAVHARLRKASAFRQAVGQLKAQR
jgi:prephenate dehydrogenase